MADYTVEVRIYGTAYIRANSPDEALTKAKSLQWGEMVMRHASDGQGNTIPVSHDPGALDIALSPYATCHGPDDGEVISEC